MCLDILIYNFYIATVSFCIGFVIGFWNLQWSWICLCRSSHLRGVLDNRCSEIYSQNPWKIPMKKFIFSKGAGWQSATFSCVPWGFYLIKAFVVTALIMIHQYIQEFGRYNVIFNTTTLLELCSFRPINEFCLTEAFNC